MIDSLVEFELNEVAEQQRVSDEMEKICPYFTFLELIQDWHEKKKPDYVKHLSVCQTKYQQAKSFKETKKRYDIYEAGKRLLNKKIVLIKTYPEWVTQSTLDYIKANGIEALVQREYLLGDILVYDPRTV